MSWEVERRMGGDRRRSRTVEAEMTLVSQALLVTLTLSKPYSFLPDWPKTWLESCGERRMVDRDVECVPILGCAHESRHCTRKWL